MGLRTSCALYTHSTEVLTCYGYTLLGGPDHPDQPRVPGRRQQGGRRAPGSPTGRRAAQSGPGAAQSGTLTLTLALALILTLTLTLAPTLALTLTLTLALTPNQLGGVSYGVIMLLVSIFGGGGMIVLEGLTFLRVQVLYLLWPAYYTLAVVCYLVITRRCSWCPVVVRPAI